MPRRPLLQVTVFFLIPIIVIELYGIAKTVAISVIAWILLQSISDSVSRRTVLICTLSFLLGSLNWYVHDLITDPLTELAGKSVHLNGRVVSCTFEESVYNGKDDIRQRAVVKVYETDTRIILNAYSESIPKMITGDYIEFSGTVRLPDARTNPACFDYRRYLRSKGISVIVTADKAEVLKEKESPIRWLFAEKEEFLSRIENDAGKNTASLMRGILFGDKSRISDEIMTDFQKNGTAHILAVSGLHVGIVYGCICWLWPWRKRWLFAVTVGALLVAYVIVSAFAVSVVRASLMVMLHLAARLANKRYDLSSAAFAIVLVITIINPIAIYDPGLQMSFLAVLTMSVLLPYIKKAHNGVLSGSIAVQAGLMPYIMYTFNCFPLGAFLINIPVIMLAGVIVPLGLAAMAACALHPILFEMVLSVLDVACSFLIRLNTVSCIDGITTFTVKSPPEFIMAFYYAGILFILSEEGRIRISRMGKKYIAVSVAAIIAISGLFDAGTRTGFEQADLTFVDVGQGDCIHVKTGSGSNYLIDGGGSMTYPVGEKILRPYLLKNGVTHVDGVVVTHLHSDHYRGIVELCCMGMVDNLYVYESNFLKHEEIEKETGLKEEQIHYVYGGMTLNLDKNASISVLSPDRKDAGEYERMLSYEEDENESSLMLMVTIDGVKTIVTGDADAEYESQLVGKLGASLDSDILKVAHHGSRYSSSQEFLNAASPEIAVIQVGTNTFGHPTEEAMNRIESSCHKLFRTDNDGAVGFELSGGDIVHTVKACH